MKWESVAVDKKVIPAGSLLEIEIYPGKTFLATDTGGYIKNKHIDIFIGATTLQEGNKYGRTTSRVRIIGKK